VHFALRHDGAVAVADGDKMMESPLSRRLWDPGVWSTACRVNVNTAKMPLAPMSPIDNNANHPADDNTTSVTVAALWDPDLLEPFNLSEPFDLLEPFDLSEPFDLLEPLDLLEVIVSSDNSSSEK